MPRVILREDLEIRVTDVKSEDIDVTSYAV